MESGGQIEEGLWAPDPGSQCHRGGQGTGEPGARPVVCDYGSQHSWEQKLWRLINGLDTHCCVAAVVALRNLHVLASHLTPGFYPILDVFLGESEARADLGRCNSLFSQPLYYYVIQHIQQPGVCRVVVGEIVGVGGNDAFALEQAHH